MARHDYTGAAEMAYIRRRVAEADAADTRTDAEIEAEIERLRAEYEEARGRGLVNVAQMTVEQIVGLRARLERRHEA